VEEFKSWAGLASILISLGTVIYAWLTSGSKQAQAELAAFKKAEAERWEKLDKALSDHVGRLQTVENELKHLPSQKSVHELQLTLKNMEIELTKVAASAEQSARTSQRVENYLLEHGK